MKARYALSICLFLAIAHNVRAQQSYIPKAGQWGPNEWKWTTEDWTGDEKPYRRIRNEIDKLIAQGRDPEALVRTYKSQTKSWMRPVDQFRWSYAAYEAARKANFRGQGRRLQDIQDALKEAAYAAPPRNYEYARLRFLSTARLTPWPQLKKIGERLVRHDPKDHEVRFFYVGVLDPDLSAQDQKVALSHAHVLIRALPKKPTVYSLMGEVYYKTWLRTNNSVDADKAIEFYNKFLNMAPADHPFRDGAKNLVRFIRKLQEHKRQKSESS